jgi:hypothetical protein
MPITSLGIKQTFFQGGRKQYEKYENDFKKTTYT